MILIFYKKKKFKNNKRLRHRQISHGGWASGYIWEFGKVGTTKGI